MIDKINFRFRLKIFLPNKIMYFSEYTQIKEKAIIDHPSWWIILWPSQKGPQSDFAPWEPSNHKLLLVTYFDVWLDYLTVSHFLVGIVDLIQSKGLSKDFSWVNLTIQDRLQ